MREFFIIIAFSCISLFSRGNTNALDKTVALNKPDSIVSIFLTDALSKKIIQLDTLVVKTVNTEYSNKREESWLKLYLPSIVALFILFVTNLVVLLKISFESKAVLKRDITLTSIKFDKERLELFYDPIYTTLSTNEDIFDSFGPRTFPDNEDLLNEASIIWNKMVENIILPNNKLISEVIISKSHLIVQEDNLYNYLNFLKHAKSYEHFIKYPNSLHKGFKYSVDFKKDVKLRRESIIQKLSILEKKLSYNGSKKYSIKN